MVGLSVMVLGGCGSGGHVTPGGPGAGGLGGGGATGGTAGVLQVTFSSKINNDLDVLFMIKNSSSTGPIQQKVVSQLPAFMQVLEQLPNGMPNLHIAVISSDMGAPGDSTVAIGCTATGDAGKFQYQVGLGATTCTTTTLAQGATFLSDADGQTNFTNPIDQVLQCITALGSNGCGFEQPLASIARALGADGSAPPAANANFLRPNAYLGIVIVSNEDDCSTPAGTSLYSLNGGGQSLSNPLGPIANYRCNQFGHLCKDPGGATISPPLNAPSAGANPPTLQLTDCASNETSTGLLTKVSTFVQQIKALKSDPDHQILVAGITAPSDPYGVEWVPPATSSTETSGQLWPEVMHACGALGGVGVNPMLTQATTDGSFGDPAVRLAEFVKAFPNSVLASVCDTNYRASMTAIATKLGGLIQGHCVTGNIQMDAQDQPACTVVNHVTSASGTVKDVPIQNCAENNSQPPCWTLSSDASACPSGGVAFRVMPDASLQSAASFTSSVTCPLCQPGSSMQGCPYLF
jgi:hypothetical protein